MRGVRLVPRRGLPALSMRLVGIAALVFIVPLFFFVMTEPPSWSGAAYVLGPLLIAIGAVVRGVWRRRLAVVGGALVLVTLGVRLVSAKGRVVNRVIDERDITINASRALGWTAYRADPDVPRLPSAMRSAYGEMASAGVDLASPLVSTLMGLERPSSSETLEVAAEGTSGHDVVIFLHGSTGNYALSCWLFARAARRAHMTTVCPSTRWTGDWWSTAGESILRDTMKSLRARGFTRIFLAGLSNGAIGASRLAPRMAGELAGLVLVSGAAPDASGVNIPTLVVQGRGDALISASVVHAYATRANAKYVELAAGHFVLLVERDAAGAAITEWLAAQ